MRHTTKPWERESERAFAPSQQCVTKSNRGSTTVESQPRQNGPMFGSRQNGPVCLVHGRIGLCLVHGRMGLCLVHDRMGLCFVHGRMGLAAHDWREEQLASSSLMDFSFFLNWLAAHNLVCWRTGCLVSDTANVW